MIGATRCVIALLLLTACAASRAVDDDQARELYTLSGLEAFVATYPQQMRMGIEGQVADLPPLVADAMTRALDRPVDLAPLHDSARRILAGTLTPPHADAVLAWLRAPLGRRLVDLEVTRGSPEAISQMLAFAKGVETAPPAARRMGLVHEIMEVLDLQTIAEQMWLASGTAVALGATAALPQTERVPAQRIREAIAAEVERLRPALMQGVVLSLLFVYAPVTDDELAVYAAFLRTPAARAYNDAGVRAMVDTLGRYSYGLGVAITDEVKSALARRSG